MPVQTVYKSNFTTGELAPRLKSRSDLGKFAGAAEQLKNMLITPAGAAVRRPGTRYIANAQDQSNACRLIPFEFSVTQAYMLEVFNNGVAFFKNQGQLIAENSDGVITNGTFNSDLTGWTTSGAAWNAGGYADVTGTTGFIEQAVTITTANTNKQSLKFQIIGAPGDTFDLRIGTSSNGEQILADTTYAAGYHLISFVPNASTYYIRFKKVTSGTAGIDNIAIIANSDPLTLQGPYTTAQAQELQYAQSADVMYIAQGDNPPHKLTRLGDDVWSLIEVNFTANPFNSAGNYPHCVAFYEQRLWFANTDNNPQSLYGSKSADFENFTVGTADDDSFVYTISTDQVNPIQWLSPGKVLAVGTSGGEFTARASSLGEAITPTNVKIVRETTRQCALTPPVRLGSTVIFIQRLNHKIRDFIYSFDIDGYSTSDLLLLAEHLAKETRITFLAHMREPWNIVWALRDDGVLLAMTYEKEQEVIAWAPQYIGGTDVVVEGIGIIPGTTQDELWISVSRTINSTTVRYIELLQQEFSILDTYVKEDAFFVDSGLTYTGSATSTITGLDHLEGETINVLSEGAVEPDKTVSSGQITLVNGDSTKVHAGLYYDTIIKDLSPELQGDGESSSQGHITGIFNASIRLHNTLGLKYGVDEANLSTLTFREGADLMDNGPNLFTGEKNISVDGWNKDQPLILKQTQPLPLTVLGIAYTVMFSEHAK